MRELFDNNAESESESEADGSSANDAGELETEAVDGTVGGTDADGSPVEGTTTTPTTSTTAKSTRGLSRQVRSK